MVHVYRAIQVFVWVLLVFVSLTYSGPAKSIPVDENGVCRCVRKSGNVGGAGKEKGLPSYFLHTTQRWIIFSHKLSSPNQPIPRA